MTGPVLCVDLGGTTMRAALVEPDGTVALRTSEPTPHERCPDALERLMISVAQHSERAGAVAVVVGVPGRVDYRHGRLEHAPNLPPTWAEQLNEEHFATLFTVPVHLANDADLAAVGESYFGAGAAYRDVVYITVSTGIGAGVVLDGQLVRGGRSLAEVGHTIVSLEHLGAGQAGSAEQLGSGTALNALAHSHGIDAEGADLVALVRDRDPAALKIWNSIMLGVSATIVNLAHLFSPEVIVIGGGLGRNGALVHDPVCHLLAKRGPQGLPRPIDLAQAHLGDDAGLAGGAAWQRATGARR